MRDDLEPVITAIGIRSLQHRRAQRGLAGIPTQNGDWRLNGDGAAGAIARGIRGNDGQIVILTGVEWRQQNAGRRRPACLGHGRRKVS